MYRPGVLSPKTPIQMAFDVAGLEGVLMTERGGVGFGFVDSLSHHPSIPLVFVLSFAPLCGSLGAVGGGEVMHVVGGSLSLLRPKRSRNSGGLHATADNELFSVLPASHGAPSDRRLR